MRNDFQLFGRGAEILQSGMHSDTIGSLYLKPCSGTITLVQKHDKVTKPKAASKKNPAPGGIGC